MNSKNISMVLASTAIVLFVILGYLLWKLNNPYIINTQSLINGTTLNINNKTDLYDFLNRIGFWQRTSWGGWVKDATQGKEVKALKVIFTDQYLWGIKSKDDPKSISSSMQIINGELILNIQVSDKGDRGNQNFQAEFVRVLTPFDKFSASEIDSIQTMYENKPTFFKLSIRTSP